MSSNREVSGTFLSETEKLVSSLVRRSTVCCPNCEHFDGGFEQCRLNSKKPPASVIAFGCEMFVNNDLPF